MSTKMRVFELAQKLGKSPEDLRDELKKLGHATKTNLSLVDAAVAEEMMSGKTAAGEAPVKKAPSTVKRVVRHIVKPGQRSSPGGVVTSTIVKPKKKRTRPGEEAVDLTAAAAKDAPAADGAAPAAAPAAAEGDKPKARLRVRPTRLTTVSLEIPKAVKPAEAVEKPKAEDAAAHAPSDGRSKPVEVPFHKLEQRPKRIEDVLAPLLARSQVVDTPFKQVLIPRRRVARKKGRKDKNEEEEAVQAPQPEGEAAPAEIRKVKMPENASVGEMAKALGIRVNDLIKKLMVDYKVMATMNQKLEKTLLETVALDYSCEVEFEGLYGEEILEKEAEPDVPENLVHRAPVVTIMGHVDHGKTTLLDAIRETNVVAKEHGGITQHIGAYKVHLPEHEGFHGGDIVFLDTPGHAAFTEMRARGARATDLVVLVVAADDAVMPQTEEAIDHARAAKVPIIVALNKIDKENANPDKVLQDLAAHRLTPEEWGGDTVICRVSAKKRTGIKELLEMLVLQADMLELKADPKRRARGVVIEAELDKGRGPVATVLVQKGTLNVGDVLVVGDHYGRVRALQNDLGERLKLAGPSTPVEVLGLSGVPQAGDDFQVVENDKLARSISGKRMTAKQERDRGARSHITLEDLVERIKTGEVKELNVVIKADVTGSVEALKKSLEDIKSDKVKAVIIHGGVGDINETDIHLAAASNAIVIGFHVDVATQAVELAHKEKVQVRLYKVIYEAIREVTDAMTGLLEPHFNEIIIGKAEVKQIFKFTKGLIAGSLVTGGKVTNKCSVRATRAGEKVYEGPMASLKRFKDDVKEVAEGMECGVALTTSVKLEPGDLLEFFVMEEVAQKI